MTFSRIAMAASLIAAIVLAGCAPTQVRNVSDAPVVSNKALTMDEVQAAITRAGTSLGWIMLEQGPGQIEGTLRLRSHVAIIDITYDTETYNIQYVESTNLNYNAEKGTIHKNYNGWIQNLDNAIQRELAAIL